MNELQLSGPSDFDFVRNLGEAVRSFAATTFSDAEALQIETALVEACNNIVEHGYKDSKGEITLDGTKTDTALTFRLKDTGSPIPDGLLESGLPNFDDDDAETLPEGGFGMFLITSIMDELYYSSENGVNTFLLTKYRRQDFP